MQRQVYWIYVQLCNHGGVKELSYTPHTIMVEFAILALAVGKRTEPLVGVRYIYLRKMSSYGGELRMISRHLYGRIQYQA